MKIPQFFKTKDITLTDAEGKEHTIKIRGFRVWDNEYVVPLQKARNQLFKIGKQLNDTIRTEEGKEKQDTDYTPEELDKIIKLKDDIEELKQEIDRNNYLLAQRGLKRFYYQDDDEFIEAEKENKGTEYIDGLPDIELSTDNYTTIAAAMIQLSSPDTTPTDEGTGKGKPEKPKRGRPRKS